MLSKEELCSWDGCVHMRGNKVLSESKDLN
jgi:hypothetical protein